MGLKILNFCRKFKLKETGVNSMSQDPKKCPVFNHKSQAQDLNFFVQ